MNILVLGAGMLAHYLRPYRPHFASKTRKDWENFHLCDIRNRESVRTVVESIRPDVVINTAVFGDIGRCEEHPELAEEINHLAHRNVISVCNENDIRLVYISTSSIFSGRTGNYREEDTPHPILVYGQTKLRGEEATRQEAGDWAIFRVTSLFGDYPDRDDFIRQLADSFRAEQTFTLWEQVVSPSYGPFVAQAMMRLVERGAKGIWHVAVPDQLPRYEVGNIVWKFIERGHIKRARTPGHIPGNRTLCVEKLKQELPELEFPDFERCVKSLILEEKQG